MALKQAPLNEAYYSVTAPLHDVPQQTRWADKLSIDAIIGAIITSDDTDRVTHFVIPSVQASIRRDKTTTGQARF